MAASAWRTALAQSAATSLTGALLAVLVGLPGHASGFMVQKWLVIILAAGVGQSTVGGWQRLVSAIRAGMSRGQAYRTGLAVTAGSVLGFVPYVLLTLLVTRNASTDVLFPLAHVTPHSPVNLALALACALLAAWGLALAVTTVQVAWQRWGPGIVPPAVLTGIVLYVVHAVLADPGAVGAGRLLAQIVRALLPSELYVLSPFSGAATAAGWALATGPLTLWLVLRRWEPVR